MIQHDQPRNIDSMMDLCFLVDSVVIDKAKLMET